MEQTHSPEVILAAFGCLRATSAQLLTTLQGNATCSPSNWLEARVRLVASCLLLFEALQQCLVIDCKLPIGFLWLSLSLRRLCGGWLIHSVSGCGH